MCNDKSVNIEILALNDVCLKTGPKLEHLHISLSPISIFYVEVAKIFMLIFNVILHEIFKNWPEFRKYVQCNLY